jgi:hypothetical protein
VNAIRVPDRVDRDADGQIDDLWINNPVGVHIERMADGHVWGAIYLPDGARFRFDLTAPTYVDFNGDMEAMAGWAASDE